MDAFWLENQGIVPSKSGVNINNKSPKPTIVTNKPDLSLIFPIIAIRIFL